MTTTTASRFVIDAPPQVWGMHERAKRKAIATHRRWRRVVIIGPVDNGRRQVWVRTSHARNRALMYERSELYWLDRLQVIVPFIVRVDVAPCIGRNPHCPCQDGDPCHYQDHGDTKAFPVAPPSSSLDDANQGPRG